MTNPASTSFQEIAASNEEVVRSLKSLSLFHDVSTDQIAHLVPLTSIRSCEKGTTIIHEGQVNSELHILMEGEVDVIVGGERVAELKRQGDLLGEMSVISSKPCTASIIAKSSVQLFSIRVKDLHTVSSESSQLQVALYRIFAMVLTEKLTITNNKAKQFEETNRHLEEARSKLEEINQNLESIVDDRTQALKVKTDELRRSNRKLESQNTQLVASHNKLEELYNAKEETLRKIAQIDQDSFPHLRESLLQLTGSGGSSESGAVQQAIAEVDQINALLKPLTNRYYSERAIRSKRVLLAQEDRKQQMMAKLALGGTGVELDIAGNREQGREFLAKGSYDVICATSSLLELTKEAYKANPKIKSVFLTAEDPAEYIDKLSEYPFLSNIVSLRDSDEGFTVRNIMTTVSKLVTEDIFGLEKYMSWGIEVQHRPIKSSKQRHELVTEMKSYFKNLGVFESVARRSAMVSEELLMNAIYDAPTDADGKPRYNHLSRRVPVVLLGEEQGQLRYACDGHRIAISVVDPFGRLGRSVILNYLESNYRGELSSLHTEDEKGGGGLGVYQIFEMSDYVVFNVKENVRSEVIAMFNIRDRKRARSAGTKSFNYFFQTSDVEALKKGA